MPLHKCTGKVYSNYFVTAGPYGADTDKVALQKDIQALFIKQYGESNIKELVTTAEHGSQGYNHVHIGISLVKDARWAKMNQILREYFKQHVKVDPEETRALSTWFGTVGTGQTGAGKTAFKIFDDYLKNPVKLKECGTVLDYDVRQKWWITNGEITDMKAALCDLMGIDFCLTKKEEAIRKWYDKPIEKRNAIIEEEKLRQREAFLSRHKKRQKVL